MHIIKAFKNEDGKLVPDKLNNEDTNAFNMLMLQGSMLNDNSFGYFTPTHVERRATKYESRVYPKIIDAPFVVGHNRFATKGESTKKNAHPFQSSRFTWVHNGIIDNDESLRKRFKLKIKSPVDSAIIGHLVEHFTKKHKTVEAAIKKAIEKIAGDFSVFLYDKLTDRLFYFRNSLRTFEASLLQLKDDNRYILIGSTDGDNLKLTYTKRVLNFDMRNAIVLSTQKISPNIIFEVNGNGFETLKHFKPLARVYNITSQDYFFKSDLDNYREIEDYDPNEFTTDYIPYTTVDEFKKVIENMGFNLTITPKEDGIGIKSVFIFGKDADEFADIYPDYFLNIHDSTISSSKVKDFIETFAESYIEE